jgi:hypothetical protein
VGQNDGDNTLDDGGKQLNELQKQPLSIHQSEPIVI